MSTVLTAPAPLTDTSEDSVKEKIYSMLATQVQDKTGKRIGKAGGRELFDTVVEQVFAAAAADGSFRFNGGFGSLHTKTYGAGSRRLPSGQQTTFAERQKIRYEEGVVVKALVKNGGRLEDAIKTARGVRPPAAPKPAKVAKGKTKASAPVAAAAGATDDAVDLS